MYESDSNCSYRAGGDRIRNYHLSQEEEINGEPDRPLDIYVQSKEYISELYCGR